MKSNILKRMWGGIQYAVNGTNSEIERLVELSTRDHLTGLYNRRGFDDHFGKLIIRSSRYNTLAGLIFADLDEFKEINDNSGYSIGDEILRESAYVVNHVLRREDIFGIYKDKGMAGRYGGDEFMIGLEVKGWSHMESAVSRIKKDITKSFEDNPKLRDLPGFSYGYAAADLYSKEPYKELRGTGLNLLLSGHILYMDGWMLSNEEFRGRLNEAIYALREKASGNMQENKRKRKLHSK